MQLRTLLTIQLSAFAVLLVGVAVSLTGWAIAHGVDDFAASRFLGRIALTCVSLWAITAIAMIATMAICLLSSYVESPHESDERGEKLERKPDSEAKT